MAKNLFILFLLILLSSLQIHARDPKLFNKIPSNKGAKETEVAVPKCQETLNNKQEQEPTFIPENENGGYGLHGHELGQLSPSTTTTTNPSDKPYKITTNLPYNNEPRESCPKYLPKNYNTKAYTTEPEGYRPGNNNNYSSNNFYNGENTYYNNEQQVLAENTYNNNEQQGLGETKLLGSSYANPSNNRNNYNNNQNNNNYYGASNSYYNGQQQGLSDTRSKNNYYYSYNGGSANGGVQKQGMSDTKFLENGKYFYDISME